MNKLAKTTSVKSLLESESVKQRLQEILGKNSATFAASVVQISQSSALSKCEPSSIVGAAMTAATLNLPINNNLGYAFIVPYGDKAQFQISVRGLTQLAQRSGQFKKLHSSDVKEGEITNRDRLTGEITFDWIQDDKERENKKTIGYVAYMRLNTGFEDTLYMSVEEITTHGKRYSQMFKRNSGLWITHFPEMATKTVLKLLLSKKAPLSVQDLTLAITHDQATINDPENIEDISYVDNEETEVDHHYERQVDVMKDLKSRDDFEFANGAIEHEELVKELHLKIVEFVNDEEGVEWAKTIVTDEVAMANLNLKSIQLKKAAKK